MINVILLLSAPAKGIWAGFCHGELEDRHSYLRLQLLIDQSLLVCNGSIAMLLQVADLLLTDWSVG